MHLTNFMKTVPDHAVQLVAVLVTICKQNTIADGQTRATSIAVQIAGFQDQKHIPWSARTSQSNS